MQMPRMVRCRDAQDAKMTRTHIQRCPVYRDAQDAETKRYLGYRDAEMPRDAKE